MSRAIGALVSDTARWIAIVEARRIGDRRFGSGRVSRINRRAESAIRDPGVEAIHPRLLL